MRYSDVESALDVLVGEARNRGARRLPPVAEIARVIGTSTKTVCRALARTRGRLGLRVSPRGGIRIADTIDLDPVLADPPRSRRSWQRLRGVLERDVLAGGLATENRLPTEAILARRYGVSPSTVRRAVAPLVADGLLVPSGRGLRRASPLGMHPYATVVLAGLGTGPGLVGAGHQRFSDMTRALELACARNGLTLRTVGVPYGQRATPGLVTVAEDHGGVALGYIVADDTVHGEDLVRLCSATGRPVVILDENGRLSRLPISRAPLIAPILIGCTQQPGMHVARRALLYGHRQAAYLSLAGDAHWDAQRFAGIAAGWEAAGLAAPLRLAEAVDFAQISGDFALGAERALGRQDEGLLTDAMVHLCFPSRDAIPIESFLPHEAVLRLHEVRVRMAVLFDRALEACRHGVWFAANDLVAVLALNYLAAHNVAVPGQISLVSFDDSFSALRYNIASYNFVAGGLADMALSFLVRPGQSRRVLGAPPFTAPGVLIERATLGPPGPALTPSHGGHE